MSAFQSSDVEVTRLFKTTRPYHKLFESGRLYADFEFGTNELMEYEEIKQVRLELVMNTKLVDDSCGLIPEFFDDKKYVYSNYYFKVLLDNPIKVIKEHRDVSVIIQDMIYCLDMNNLVNCVFKFLSESVMNIIDKYERRVHRLYDLKDTYDNNFVTQEKEGGK